MHVYKTREFAKVMTHSVYDQLVLIPLFSGTTASLELTAYVFLESANDTEVCVTLANAAERSITLSLSTNNGTAFGNNLYTCCLTDS